MFPLARGGKAAIPGGFGTGKTVLLETLAKWCDADVIVYVGCGERGNEIAGLLETDFANVNIKAKTNEGLDAVGEGKAIASTAMVLLKRRIKRTL